MFTLKSPARIPCDNDRDLDSQGTDKEDKIRSQDLTSECSVDEKTRTLKSDRQNCLLFNSLSAYRKNVKFLVKIHFNKTNFNKRLK